MTVAGRIAVCAIGAGEINAGEIDRGMPKVEDGTPGSEREQPVTKDKLKSAETTTRSVFKNPLSFKLKLSVHSLRSFTCIWFPNAVRTTAW
jgi:hypothetical protein